VTDGLLMNGSNPALDANLTLPYQAEAVKLAKLPLWHTV